MRLQRPSRSTRRMSTKSTWLLLLLHSQTGSLSRLPILAKERLISSVFWRIIFWRAKKIKTHRFSFMLVQKLSLHRSKIRWLSLKRATESLWLASGTQLAGKKATARSSTSLMKQTKWLRVICLTCRHHCKASMVWSLWKLKKFSCTVLRSMSTIIKLSFGLLICLTGR